MFDLDRLRSSPTKRDRGAEDAYLRTFILSSSKGLIMRPRGPVHLDRKKFCFDRGGAPMVKRKLVEKYGPR